jgi:hypothetical protein
LGAAFYVQQVYILTVLLILFLTVVSKNVFASGAYLLFDYISCYILCHQSIVLPLSLL